MARKTSTIMGTGSTFPATGIAGSHQSTSAGPPTATEGGVTSTTTAGPGSAASLGAGLLITTAAGSITRSTAGAGIRAHTTAIITGGPRWLLSSASTLVSGSASEGHYPYRHVGWVPLAPGERYYPWYGRGSRRVGGGRNAVIVNNNINIHNGFRNARANNGVNVVTAERFARGLASQPRSLRASELRRATVMRGQIPVVPEAQSRGNVVRLGDTETRFRAERKQAILQHRPASTSRAQDQFPASNASR